MAPLSDVSIESISENTEGQEIDILPTPPNETSIQSTSATNQMQKQRLQQYLKKIKRVVRDRSPVKKNGRLTTLDSLHEVLNILNSGDSTQKMVKQESAICLEEKPLSPAESSWSSETDQNSNVIKNEASISEMSRSKHNSTETTTICNRLIVTVFLELPQGTIIEILPNNSDKDTYQLCSVLKRGDSFLEVLQGKGAQTMLLNAFCGHSKRRMYARIKCDQNAIEPFELLCEFSPSSEKSSTCKARIQILRLESVVHQPINQPRAIFTTRHNASSAVIYLDSASIPSLGHFPSEITGRSIFSLIHPDDVQQLKQAHAQLRSNNGRIVSTPSLRMVSYNGTIVYTNSEWAGFVNPWTEQIEMIVGRHSVVPTTTTTQSTDSLNTLQSMLSKDPEIEISNNIKPITTVNSYIGKIVETLINSSADQHEVVHHPDSPQSMISLSINQINCLENVNRLLKSQSDAQSQLSHYISGSTTNEQQIPLTKEILHQHNKKCEEECKFTWKNRLLKRTFDDTLKHVEPVAKLSRTDATTGFQHTVSPFSVNTIAHNFTNTGYANQNFSLYDQNSQPVNLIHPEQAIYATFWLDYLNAIQLHAANCNHIAR